MFSKLFILVSLALSAAASPLAVRKAPVSLPLARHFNATGSRGVLARDQARAKFLKSGSKSHAKSAAEAAQIPVPVTDIATIYTAALQVGNPPTTFNLIVDTGSSNTWVGATTEYDPTSSATDTGEEVFVEYGSGLFFGEEFIDTVTLAPGLTIPQQSIGAAEFAIGFQGVDGILGIGPTDLTGGTTEDGELVPTVTDNAFSLGLIDTKLVSVAFEPTTSLSDTNGELTFGGINPEKFTGTITTVPITSTSPANEFVGIDQTVTYGTAGTPILAQTAGIADTGTTLLLLATDALEAYQAATGAVEDENTGLLKLTPAQFASLESLFFQIGDTSFEFTPNAQIWPRSLNTAIGGDPDDILLIVSDLGSPSGEGLDFIDGFAFLERHLLVFDSGKNEVGIAQTPFTFATTN